MPTYEWECPKCHETIELWQSLADTNKPLCCREECGGIEMMRIISRTSFQLKGSGWAKDGYSK